MPIAWFLNYHLLRAYCCAGYAISRRKGWWVREWQAAELVITSWFPRSVGCSCLPAYVSHQCWIMFLHYFGAVQAALLTIEEAPGFIYKFDYELNKILLKFRDWWYFSFLWLMKEYIARKAHTWYARSSFTTLASHTFGLLLILYYINDDIGYRFASLSFDISNEHSFTTLYITSDIYFVDFDLPWLQQKEYYAHDSRVFGSMAYFLFTILYMSTAILYRRILLHRIVMKRLHVSPLRVDRVRARLACCHDDRRDEMRADIVWWLLCF